MSEINWDFLPPATEDNKRAADLIIRTDDGSERRTGYDGGWLFYQDATHTSESKQSIDADAETLFAVDGAGSESNYGFRRGLNTDVWSLNTVRPVAIGEVYALSIDFKVSKSSSTQTFVHLAGKVGSGYATSVTDERKPLTKGSGITDFQVFYKTIFVRDGYTTDGLRFFLTFDEAVQVWDKTISIQRTHSP
jgi:hypothetical protein